MNAPPSIPELPGGAAPLRARRCVRHTEREAVARCPGCQGFFCRECVVDHDGRLTCAACLARATTAATPRTKRSWARASRAVVFGASVVALWVLFYATGSLLLRVPTEVHEGTVWRRPFEELP